MFKKSPPTCKNCKKSLICPSCHSNYSLKKSTDPPTILESPENKDNSIVILNQVLDKESDYYFFNDDPEIIDFYLKRYKKFNIYGLSVYCFYCNKYKKTASVMKVKELNIFNCEECNMTYKIMYNELEQSIKVFTAALIEN